jgi:predicted phage terminase large subunit-like protein
LRLARSISRTRRRARVRCFKLADLRRYDSPPQRFDRIVISLDTAFKTTETADYSALVVIGETSQLGVDGSLPGYYLLSLWRGRVEFGQLKHIVMVTAGDYRPTAVVVEDAASGQSLIQELKVETNLPVVSYRPDHDKRARGYAVQPAFEAGRVFLPESRAPWLEDYIGELTAFPAGRHDDFVDATTMALAYLRTSPKSFVQICDLTGGPIRYDSRFPRGRIAPLGDLERGGTPRATGPHECANCHCLCGFLDLRTVTVTRADGLPQQAIACVVCARKLNPRMPDYLRA